MRDAAQLHETLARLVGLLRAERVGRPVLEETHRPDAFRMEPFVWEFPEENDSEVGKRIPLRCFRKRTKATVLLENNRPVHLRGGETEGVTIAHAGPFPISGNWWDEKAWARVEWDVELENGVVARCHCDKEGWALDGIYD